MWGDIVSEKRFRTSSSMAGENSGEGGAVEEFMTK